MISVAQQFHHQTEPRILHGKVQFPAKLYKTLFQPATIKSGRYKVIYGGRGSAKSMSVALSLLLRGIDKKLKILCAREIQNSIKDSVHALLKQLISDYGLDYGYDVQNDSIKGSNGTEFIFKGLRFNALDIKSLQGVDICWVEEADKVSANSWTYLVPTIRNEYADGTCSEIIITFNPELEEDFTYQEYVVAPPASALVVQMNWRDNPFFPAVLDAERQADLAKPRYRDMYNWKWEGTCKQVLEGSIYADELRAAELERRIGNFPYVRGVPVNTYWDLGRSDTTAIWFIQRIGMEWRAIDFHEDAGLHISRFIEVLQNKKYVYGTHHLPHDASNQYVGQKNTVESQMRDASIGQVRIIQRPTRKINGINAGRTMLSQAFIDREHCADGLSHMRRYSYDVDVESKKRSTEPLHDIHSNAADAWQTFGLSVNTRPKEDKPLPSRTPIQSRITAGQGWAR